MPEPATKADFNETFRVHRFCRRRLACSTCWRSSRSSGRWFRAPGLHLEPGHRASIAVREVLDYSNTRGTSSPSSPGSPACLRVLRGVHPGSPDAGLTARSPGREEPRPEGGVQVDSDGVRCRHSRIPLERQPLGSHLSGSVPIPIAVHVVCEFLVVIIEQPRVSRRLPSRRASTSCFQHGAAAAAATGPGAPAAARQLGAAGGRQQRRAQVGADGTSLRGRASPAPPDVGIPNGLGDGTADLGAIGSIGQPVAFNSHFPRQAGPARVADLPVPPRKIVDVRPVSTASWPGRRARRGRSCWKPC